MLFNAMCQHPTIPTYNTIERFLFSIKSCETISLLYTSQRCLSTGSTSTIPSVHFWKMSSPFLCTIFCFHFIFYFFFVVVVSPSSCCVCSHLFIVRFPYLVPYCTVYLTFIFHHIFHIYIVIEGIYSDFPVCCGVKEWFGWLVVFGCLVKFQENHTHFSWWILCICHHC